MTALSNAAYLRLRADNAFQIHVQNGEIGSDALNTASFMDRMDALWLFQGLDDEGRPFRDPEGSGTSVVVLRSRSAGGVGYTTAIAPQLQVLVYSDSTRAADGSPTSMDAETKCEKVLRTIDRCFHLPSNREADHSWGGLRVFGQSRDSRMTIMDVPGTQSYTVRGEWVYEVITD